MGVGRAAKKSIVTIVGGGLVLLGFALMILPGPGLLVSVAGFAILATEYAWARRALDKTRDKAVQGQRQVATNRLLYGGQLLFGVGMIAASIYVLWFKPDIPFATPVVATTVLIGGVILITSAVVSRRKYSGSELSI